MLCKVVGVMLGVGIKHAPMEREIRALTSIVNPLQVTVFTVEILLKWRDLFTVFTVDIIKMTSVHRVHCGGPRILNA